MRQGARPAVAESGRVAGGASAARTGPQRGRRNNPADRAIPARGSRRPRLVCALIRASRESAHSRLHVAVAKGRSSGQHHANRATLGKHQPK